VETFRLKILIVTPAYGGSTGEEKAGPSLRRELLFGPEKKNKNWFYGYNILTFC